MQLNLNPSREELRKYGLLAYVSVGERLRVLDTMNNRGLRLYCEQIEDELERRKKR